MRVNFRVPEIVLGVLLAVLVFTMGFVAGSSAQPQTPSNYQRGDEGKEKQSNEKQYVSALNWALPDAMSLYNLILVVFTGGLASIAWIQIRQTRILQRAYLGVEPLGVRPFSYDIYMLGWAGFKNTGHIPAREARYFIKIEASSDRNRFSDGFYIPEQELSGNNVVTPGSMMTQAAQTIITREDVDAIKRVESYIYVWGAITYNDGFGKRRFTNFCHRYNYRGLSADPRTMDETSLTPESGRYHEWGNDAD